MDHIRCSRLPIGETPVRCQAEAPCCASERWLVSSPLLPRRPCQQPVRATTSRDSWGLQCESQRGQEPQGKKPRTSTLPSVGGLNPTGNTGRSSGPLGFLPSEGLGMGTERETDLWRKLSFILITGQQTDRDSFPTSGYEKDELHCFSTLVLPTFGARSLFGRGVLSCAL